MYICMYANTYICIHICPSIVIKANLSKSGVRNYCKTLAVIVVFLLVFCFLFPLSFALEFVLLEQKQRRRQRLLLYAVAHVNWFWYNSFKRARESGSLWRPTPTHQHTCAGRWRASYSKWVSVCVLCVSVCVWVSAARVAKRRKCDKKSKKNKPVESHDFCIPAKRNVLPYLQAYFKSKLHIINKNLI